MDENKFIDWQDENWNELALDFAKDKDGLFFEYCQEKYINKEIGNE